MTPSSFQIDLPETTLARASRGESAALEAIYRSFERPAYTLALRMTTNREDAREVVHDAMLHMFQRIGQFRGESPFWGWLRQIVVNEALMRLRRDRSQILESYDETVSGNDLDGESVAWNGFADASLERAIQALPVVTRSVIWLYHVEGYTHPEIAELTGNSVSFSKSQLARGTQRLRAMLQDRELQDTTRQDTQEASHG